MKGWSLKTWYSKLEQVDFLISQQSGFKIEHFENSKYDLQLIFLKQDPGLTEEKRRSIYYPCKSKLQETEVSSYPTGCIMSSNNFQLSIDCNLESSNIIEVVKSTKIFPETAQI